MVNICIFDAYGTLFDVTSATRIVANEEEYSSFPNHSVKVSNSWRIKQLEYSWLRNIMHEYIDFWQITKDALDFALEENQIKNEKLRQRLLDVYWNLSAYPEA
ncbi:MAG: haloacid dehalogenase, partial [Rhodobacteraceae bacterium]